MGIIQRQAFLNTIVNYVGVVIGFVNVVILFPLFLSQEEFGLTRLVLSLISVMAQMSSFGVHRIAIKFFPVFRKQEHKNNGLFLILFLLSLTGTIIISLIYFLFKQPILHYYQDEASLFNDYYIWIPLSTLGMVVFLVFESFLQVLRKTVFTNFLRNIVVRLYWLVALFFYYKGHCTFYQFMLIYMLGYFFVAALCVLQLMVSKEFSFDINKMYFKTRLLKPMVNYGAYTIFSGLTLILVVSVDTLMIGALLPEDKLSFVGIYAVATYIASVIFVPNTALARIASPLIAHDWRVKDLKNIDEVYKKSSVLMSFAGGIIFGAIAINIDEILALMQPEFAAAKYVVLVLGFSRLLSMTFGVNYAILVVTKFYRAETFLAIFLLVLVVVTNLIFIPIYGILGAAIGTGLAIVMFNLLTFIYIKQKIKLQPFSLGTINMLLIGGVAGAITYFLPLSIENHILSIIMKSAIFCFLYILPVYIFKISEDINSVIDKYLFRR